MIKILIAALILCTGCAPRYLMYSEEKFPELHLMGKIKKVRIEDARGGVKKIHVAFLNPDHPSRFKNPIDSIDSTKIVGQVLRNWTGSGESISVTIRVDEAEAGYQVFFFHSDEFSNAKINMLVFLDQNKVAECAGNAELEKKSQKAGENSMKKMFDETLELSVYKCLDALKTQFGSLRIDSTDPGHI